MINLDKGIVEAVQSLKMNYLDRPQPELLIRLPFSIDTGEEAVDLFTNEFTSLCPLNMAQPDYAGIHIFYSPKDYVAELKSLKYYLVSFRQCPIFHEQVPKTIVSDLVKLLDPWYLLVEGKFSTRGGLDTTVKAEYVNPTPRPSRLPKAKADEKEHKR